jgi:hypothetical protein
VGAEQRRLTFERCCPACSTRDTHAGGDSAAQQDDASLSRVELALLRTLSDIDDGHLILWISGRFFDPHTGDPLDPPQIRVIPDRQPYRGVPDPGGAWWDALVQRGWLEMPVPGTTPMCYRVSQAGRDVLLAARRAGRLRHRSPGSSRGGTDASTQPPHTTQAPAAPRRENGPAACGIACGIAWGVCPQDGVTLAVIGDSTHCQVCGRTWPGDRLNLPCPEPITRTEEERHLGRTGMCAGHALALTAVHGITTEPLRPGQPAPESGVWDHGGEAARYVRCHYQLPAAKRNDPHHRRRPARHHPRLPRRLPGGALRRSAHRPHPVPSDRTRHLPGSRATGRSPATRRRRTARSGHPRRLHRAPTERQRKVTAPTTGPPAVRPGQVWAGNDPRAAGRTIRVERLDGDKAICRVLTNSDEA